MGMHLASGRQLSPPPAVLLVLYLRGKHDDGMALHTCCGPASVVTLLGHGTSDLCDRALGAEFLFVLARCCFLHFKRV